MSKDANPTTAPPTSSQPQLSFFTLAALVLSSSLLSSVFLTYLQPKVPELVEQASQWLHPPIKASDQIQLRENSTDEDFNQYLRTYVCQHKYSVSILHRDPLIMLIDNFLQPGEAEYVRHLAKPLMQRSSVAASPDDYYSKSDVRTSSSAFLLKSQDPVIKCIEDRSSMFSGIPLPQIEPLQVVWYTKGQKYEPHLDWFDREFLNDYWSQFGQRYVTILAYINDEGITGGHTSFPLLGVSVPPKKNAAVFWYNVGFDEMEDKRTLHGGMPVEGGEKWAINIWQRKMLPSIIEEKARAAAAEEAGKNEGKGVA